jgi:integrase
MIRLTKRLVEATKPAASDVFLWDGDVTGFGCRIYPSGKRAYLIQYRKRGRTRRYVIGLHGRITVEEARAQAKILLGRVVAGEDVAELRSLDYAAITVSKLCDLYLEAAEKGTILGKGNRPKRPSTLYVDRGRIARHIKPLLGSRKVKDLGRADIKRFMDDVSTGKSKADLKTKRRGRAIVSGGSGTARRTVGLFGGILTYAIDIGIRADNPAHGVRRSADNRRHVKLTAEQYCALGKTLTEGAAAEAYPTAANLCRILALTGCRRGEIEKLKWTEINFDGASLDFEDSKEGEGRRPIGKPALELLKIIPRTEDLVFSSAKAGHPYSQLPKAWKQFRAASKLPWLTPHGLRHAYASVAGELGYNELTIAALLGHRSGGVTRGYVHLDKLLVEAADRVAAQIHAYMNGASAVIAGSTQRKAA